MPGTLHLLRGGGCALTAAIPWGAIAAVGEGPLDLYSMNHHADRHTEKDRGGPGEPGDPPAWTAPALAALHACGVRAARIVVNRELPAQTGLLRGAETFCAVSQALGEIHGRPVPSWAAAYGDDPAYVTGLHARAGHALFVRGRGGSGGIEHVPCDLAAEGLRFLIIETGLTEGPPPGKDRPSLLVEAAAAALRAGDMEVFGALLDDGHVRGEPVLDRALDAAREAGALGGLVAGHCAVALVPVAAVRRVRERVKARLAGSVRRPPRFLTAVPAGRDRTRAEAAPAARPALRASV